MHGWMDGWNRVTGTCIVHVTGNWKIGTHPPATPNDLGPRAASLPSGLGANRASRQTSGRSLTKATAYIHMSTRTSYADRKEWTLPPGGYGCLLNVAHCSDRSCLLGSRSVCLCVVSPVSPFSVRQVPTCMPTCSNEAVCRKPHQWGCRETEAEFCIRTQFSRGEQKFCPRG